MDTLVSMLVSSALTVCSGVILFLLKRLLTRQQEKEERREREVQAEPALVLRSLNALGKLTVANSIALRDGKTNGEMSSALQEYEAVEKEMYDYLISRHSSRQ